MTVIAQTTIPWQLVVGALLAVALGCWFLIEDAKERMKDGMR